MLKRIYFHTRKNPKLTLAAKRARGLEVKAATPEVEAIKAATDAMVVFIFLECKDIL